ncbi:RICIN domain-containing protein [Streptomyces sp. NPDC002082]|uniref:RICIN domain-containing protein n=1 Tax=Streptomyces sp. NPDC002082 TaxID=3154772 RepID=UPI0033254BC3
MISKKLGILGAAAVMAAALIPANSASAAPTGYSNLQNYNSNKCLVVLANGSKGTRATQTTCGNFKDQQWTTPSTEYVKEIRNAYSGKCLTVQGTADGAPVFEYTCTGLNDQKWYLYHVGNTMALWYVNYNSNKCLLIQGPEEGNAAVQYNCAKLRDQMWTVVPL